VVTDCHLRLGLAALEQRGQNARALAIISDIPRSQETQDLRATPFEIRNLMASNVNDSEGA
jgi:hypothetical protein